MDGNSVAGKYAQELINTAKAITAPGKGILAADESTGTVGEACYARRVGGCHSWEGAGLYKRSWRYVWRVAYLSSCTCCVRMLGRSFRRVVSRCCDACSDAL